MGVRRNGGVSKKMKAKLYEKLIQLQRGDYYPFHMPGHKRNLEIMPKWNGYGIDITEIDEFDNLHDAEEILKETMEAIAEFRGAKQSFMLVNGSTCGILAAISACTKQGDEILLARNCHKAVYHAIQLRQLSPHYIYPHFSHILGMNGEIMVDEVEKMLITFPKTRTIVLTSPTYEGVISDISSLAELVHKYGKTLIIDQAHGAHLGMGREFAASAMACGADVVIESVHKTLPAPTQTALLHVQGDLVNCQKIRKYLGIYQTSSPSYPLMAGISWCMDYCMKETHREFVAYEERLRHVRAQIGALEHIVLFEGRKANGEAMGYAYDQGKLVFGIRDRIWGGAKLYKVLREKYHLQMEMASLWYVIAMTSVLDTEEGFERLIDALGEIDQEIEKEMQESKTSMKLPRVDETCEELQKPPENECAIVPWKIEEMETKWLDFSEIQGKIAADYLYLYPPGIPLVVPGEVISEELLAYIALCEKNGLQVKGKVKNRFPIVR